MIEITVSAPGGESHETYDIVRLQLAWAHAVVLRAMFDPGSGPVIINRCCSGDRM